jgi:hypothetical protein
MFIGGFIRGRDADAGHGSVFHVGNPTVVSAAKVHLFKIVNYYLCAHAFEHLLDKLQVQRVDLISVLGFLIVENDIESDLIRLIHDRAIAVDHLPDMEMQYARDRFEILNRAGNEFIRSFWIIWVRPKDNDM